MKGPVRRLLVRFTRRLATRLGFDLVWRDYYSPIPDLSEIPEEMWDGRSDLVGLRFGDVDRQLDYVSTELAPYIEEFRPPPSFHIDNGAYGPVDTEVLYAMVRAHKPRRVLEIGAGFSTLVTAAACERNGADGRPGNFVAVDPYPAAFLRTGVAGLAKLRQEKATDVPAEAFADLGAGDILFLDTTHTVKLGGDVTHLILEALPRLAPGVIVHVHDVFLPWHYPRRWFETNAYYWAEQYMIQAFLAFNDEFEPPGLPPSLQGAAGTAFATRSELRLHRRARRPLASPAGLDERRLESPGSDRPRVGSGLRYPSPTKARPSAGGRPSQRCPLQRRRQVVLCDARGRARGPHELQTRDRLGASDASSLLVAMFSRRMEGANSTLLPLLEGRFEFEDGDSYGTPSGNYYWFRKRRQVASLLERNLDCLALRDGSVVADLGCGSGSDLFVVRRTLGKANSGCSYIGVEADPRNLEVCRLRSEHYGNPADVSFITADIGSSLPFETGSVSLLYCSEVVEHLPNPERLFQEAARVVHSGGHFLLTTPNQPNPLQRSFWFPRRRRAMRDAARQAGVETEAAAQEGGTVPLHGHISLLTTRLWDQAVSAHGFVLADFGRGALHYGSTPFADREPILAGTFAVQTILDLLPKRITRCISDQAIALYRRLP